MKFQVGRFTCEMSLDETGEVVTTWWPEAPKYLDAANRRQYRAGRDAFLREAGKLPPRLGARTAGSWHTLQRLTPVLLVASVLTGCARGGGIGLEATLADQNCEQAGYQLGTPEYANCRMAAQRQSAMNAAAMQAFYARQAEIARQNQPQICSYNGSNIGGITGGTMTCR
jgi:hypothetical protein